jgi:hypothetical protein
MLLHRIYKFTEEVEIWEESIVTPDDGISAEIYIK